MSIVRRQLCDVLVDVIEVIYHQILFSRGVYVPDLFQKAQFLGLVVQQSRHPELTSYVQEIISGLKVPLLINLLHTLKN